MRQDARDDCGLLDARDDAPLRAAAGAALDLDSEDSLQRPRPVMSLAGDWQELTVLGPFSQSPTQHHHSRGKCRVTGSFTMRFIVSGLLSLAVTGITLLGICAPCLST